MKIKPFALERYFAQYEFTAKYLLSSSDCDGLMQSEVLSWADPETKKLWENLQLGYTESLGLPLLRKEIAKLYAGISPDQILVAAPEECIFIALNSLLKNGDQVICTYPGYQSLYEIAAAIGCEVEKWEPDESAGWYFNPGDLESKIKKNTRLIIVNFPHNPTGYLPSIADYQAIFDIARKHGIPVFSDEMYRFLELNPDQRLPSACELYEKAVTLFGMSKTFGLAGLRIGWIITQDTALYHSIAAYKDYTTICSSAPSEILASIGLRSKEKIIDRHLRRINRNLCLLDDFFEKHRHLFSWIRPKAGTIGLPRLLSEESSGEFCRRVVENRGIMLLPSTVFNYGSKHLRLGFGRENMPEVLNILACYLAPLT